TGKVPHVLSVNFRRFVLHGDHGPQGIAKAIVTVLGTIPANCKMPHGSFSSIEVTVPHEIVWRVHRSFVKIVALSFFAVLPEHHITFPLSNNNDRSRSVPVKRAATSWRKLRDVAAVGSVCQGKAHMLYAFPLHGKIIENKPVY